MITDSDPSPMAIRRRALGVRGERIAEQHLIDLGMTVLDRNWRCSMGEIDLVLRDGDELVICEVKTRSTTDFGHPLEAVDQRKADRLRRLGGAWLQTHRARPAGVRIDLIGIVVPRHGDIEIEHVAGVG